MKDVFRKSCMTIKKECGKGCYPLLLQYIIDEHPERDY